VRALRVLAGSDWNVFCKPALLVSFPGLIGQSSIPGRWLLDPPVNPRIKSGEGDDSGRRRT